MIRFLLVIGRTWKSFEKWVVPTLLFICTISVVGLLWQFRQENTIDVPSQGGTYIEGSVGILQPLNPWFTIQNDVNRDIVSLVFAGLLRYNPETRAIEEDLATMRIANGGRTYLLTLKKDLFWHDSTEENPHPVTSDDVLFTFQTVQNDAFPNQLLTQNFQGVTLKKIDNRTVQFALEKPYSFFPSNLTLGLLPKRAFEGIPVHLLDQTLDFGFSPIGAGPYTVKNVLQTDLSTEVTLEKFTRTIPPTYRLGRIVFRIFPDYFTLLSDLKNLHSIRTVPRNDQGAPVIPRRFLDRQYTLPQYVALFFNVDRPILQDQQLRLGLQLGTNKQEVVDAIGETVIVDTPLLEIDTSDWRYQFDLVSAQGALFESQWYYPEKIRLQRLLEQRDANRTGVLHFPAIALLDTGALLTLTGSVTPASFTKSINSIPLQEHAEQENAWIVQLPTDGSTGSLAVGSNLVRLTNQKGRVLDSFYIWRTTSPREFQRAATEQLLIERFVQSRQETFPDDERISVADLTVDEGFLRLKRSGDPVGIRMNDNKQQLRLTLLTSNSPSTYKVVAESIAQQWKQLGVEVEIDIPDTRTAFEQKLLERDYDVLLFGQSLLDNLDSYPYWHSSSKQNITGRQRDLRLDAYNLSQYASFEADALLKTIRETTNEQEREKTLSALREILKKDVPAIFLYSPQYTFAHTDALQGVDLYDLSLHSDRFLTLDSWYVKKNRIFSEGKNWLSFFPWVLNLFSSDSEIDIEN